MAKKTTKKRGRPKGKGNAQVQTVDVRLSRCNKGGSTERSKYYQKRELALTGINQDGEIYNRVIWRRTRCLECDQIRDDRTYIFVPPTD